jgi:hypothetical protein
MNSRRGQYFDLAIDLGFEVRRDIWAHKWYDVEATMKLLPTARNRF